MQITQLLPTIQGEGPSVGLPILLIRFHKCNLICPFCDTESLIKGETLNITMDDILLTSKKYNLNRIVFTGGEPLLYLKDIKQIISQLSIIWEDELYIEIETNGTLIAHPPIDFELNEILREYTSIGVHFQFNVSPKITTDCHTQKSKLLISELYTKSFERFQYLNVIPNIKNVSSIFKFIYSKSTEDLLLHYLTLLKPYNFMSMEDVYIMPLTPDILIYDENTFTKLFRISMQDTVDFCIRKSLRYCCREHIHIFGKLKNEYLESSILKE